ncbi:xanthine dehydrogenase YagR molybdenum-binding subunit [Catenuloplanes nepalensis]|uniref:Xanthine dehydrogenase YagR molybdenum-binding subunit n=1 Tax=Catenuloplanes nepalensis TaxID=587533 RepID=A0ABT9MW42_9ACTN|nr:xanthine dehydrogenase family protein molybdopterin-binding subunit [Catenuloplanes nepalensis]MDP9795604.1 xanthine dehydrogenase YagR molybdenum-binding subunit [Catenuloplanes nepalensis]
MADLVSPVGRDIDRVEGRLKVAGAAEYSADRRVAGMLYAAVVTSTIGKGAITGIDTAAATAVPGFVDVFHHARPLMALAAPPGPGENYAPLQDALVRFHGQIVALVVAESPEAARDAASLVSVTYRAEPPRTSMDGNMPGVPANTPNLPPAMVTVLEPRFPTIDAALAASEVVVRSTTRTPVQHHVAMEPHGALAVREGDALTVYTGAQMPIVQATRIRAKLRNEPATVRVLAPYVGGAFGSRAQPWSDVVLAAAAAWTLRRPVKLILTREQVFTVVGHRGEVRQTVRLGASRDGVLTAVAHESDAELPFVSGWPMRPADDTSAVTYRTPNLHIAQRLVMLDRPPTWAMRAPNEAAGAFALETAMDELAVATGVDPVELRLRNSATVAPATGLPWSSKHLDEAFRVGARRFGWSARRARPRPRIDGQWLVGVGTAAAVYPANRESSSVRVRLCADDTAVVSTSISDPGTGAETLLAIAGADVLGITVRRVRPELGDSLLPPGPPVAGSSVTASTVPTVAAAARNATAQLIQLAVTHARSPWHGADPAGLSFADGRLRGNGRAMTFGRLLSTVGAEDVVGQAQTVLDPVKAGQFMFHSFGAHFCEVRVNRFTGEPRVTRFTTVVDGGRIMNTQAAHSQIVGGVIFGIGQALLEHDPVEPGGRPASANLADYMVPVNADIPPIDVHWLDHPDPELGARGIGEIGTVGSAAAVGNAVFDATGIRVRELPITLDRLLLDPGEH